MKGHDLRHDIAAAQREIESAHQLRPLKTLQRPQLMLCPLVTRPLQSIGKSTALGGLPKLIWTPSCKRLFALELTA